MNRRTVLAMLPMTLMAGLRGSAQGALTVYKDATCGCCAQWVEHMRRAGFTATVNNVRDMAAVKDKYRVPAAARSCHTAVLGNYVIEGHVPADDVKRLLKERPAAAGLAVPGMPIGSPGMEMQGLPTQAYDVVLLDSSGKTRVYASHGK